MKKVFTAALSAVIFITSCSSTDKPAGDVATDKQTKTAVANPGKMDAFMLMLDGTEGSAQKAADAYFTDSLKNSLEESNSLTFVNYNMMDAKVGAVDGPCCTMEAKAGVTTRSFKLCWQGDKVISVEDLGIK